jgi:hypothetical protein
VFILHAGLGVAGGLWALRSALRRVALTLEELALAVAWGFVVGGSFWLRAFLARDSFLGFYAPWTWLTAAHFHVAGFAALTITALCVRLTPSRRGRSTLRSLLVFHPLLFAGVAAGLTGVPYVDDVAAVGYATLFAVQLLVVARTVTWSLLPFGSSPVRIVAGRLLLLGALAVPLVTLIPAIAWALHAPLWDFDQMIERHGLVNALGHAGVGLFALLLLQPRPLFARVSAPFSKLGGGHIGSGYLDDKAPEHARTPTGLSDDLAAYARADFHPGRLHPELRAFYVDTAAFDLDVSGVWHPPFRLAGALWADWIAPALGQLGLPSPTRALYASAMNSRIVDVDDTLDGRTNVRGWVRTWRDTGRPVYTAVYAEAVTDGVCTMNIAFPLPWGNLSSLLHLSATDAGELVLTSRHERELAGQQGVYFVIAGRGWRTPLDETIRVWPVLDPPAADPARCLEARHDMWIAGIPFLSLDYQIRRRPRASAGANEPIAGSGLGALHGQARGTAPRQGLQHHHQEQRESTEHPR